MTWLSKIGLLPGQAIFLIGYQTWDILRKSRHRLDQLLKRIAGEGNDLIYRFFVVIVVALLAAVIGASVVGLFLLENMWLSWPVVAILCGIVLLFIGGGYEDRSVGAKLSTFGLAVLVVAVSFAFAQMSGSTSVSQQSLVSSPQQNNEVAPKTRHYEVRDIEGNHFDVFVPPEYADNFAVYQQACRDLSADRDIAVIDFWNDRSKMPSSRAEIIDIPIDKLNASVANYIKNMRTGVNDFTWTHGDNWQDVGPILPADNAGLADRGAQRQAAPPKTANSQTDSPQHSPTGANSNVTLRAPPQVSEPSIRTPDSTASSVAGDSSGIASANVKSQIPSANIGSNDEAWSKGAKTPTSSDGLSGEFRTWSDVTGRYKITGQFVSVDAGIVKLKKSDGKIINAHLEKLCDADRQFIENLVDPFHSRHELLPANSASAAVPTRTSIAPAAVPRDESKPTATSPKAALRHPTIIELSDREEFALVVGKLRKGTKVTFQYLSGKWKDWGRSPTESPDTDTPERGDECRVAIVSDPLRGNAKVLMLVPADTQSHPYVWVCPGNFERIVLRINSKLGDYAKHPGGVVRYRLTISAP